MKEFLYIPWIEAHGDVLLREVFDNDQVLSLLPLRFTPKGDDHARRALFHFALRHPKTYARLVENRLLSTSRPIHGLVLTLDWAAPMRIAAQVAQSHNIPVILLPHEGAFMDEQRFYRDPFSGANCSIADHFLAWGHLQKDIMVSRGYPEENVKIISSPKLQHAAHYKPELTRDEYCRRLGLAPERKIIMFCAQTLDNVADRKGARVKQADSVLALFEFCQTEGHQLIVRLPPIQHETILQDRLRQHLQNEKPIFVTPGQGGVEVDARESVWHADCVTSISSTMLLEKGLMNGPSFAFDCVDETSPFVERGRLPAVNSQTKLHELLPRLLENGGRSFPDDGWRQLERDYSNGDFGANDAITDIRNFFAGYDTPLNLNTCQPIHKTGTFLPEAARRVHSLIFKTLIRLKAPFRDRLARASFPPLP